MPQLHRQIAAASRSTLLSLPRRLPISLSMVGSIALVVCILTAFLAMANGFESALKSAGSRQIAVVLGGGTNAEANSEIDAGTVRTLLALSGDIGVTRDAGAPILSREIIAPVEHRTDGAAQVGEILALRGMDPSGIGLRESASIAAGRAFAPGTNEIMVGERLAATHPGLEVGERVRLGPIVWTVVGHFATHGSAFESEIWADLDAVRAAFGREGETQSLRLRLTDPAAIDRLRAAISNLGTAPITVLREADLYAAQAAGTVRLIRVFGWPIALLMAIGACAGALNTMMSSLADRTTEIATLRALGFSGLSAFAATWLEALVLAAAGAALGLLVSVLIFNGWQASTLGANNARMSFELAVNGDAMVTAAILGLSIGALGGAFPALAAARLPITRALRAQG